MNNGNVNNNNKNNTNRVRAVAPVPVAGPSSSATTPTVYDIPFSSIVEAWIDCEQNKRSSNSCTKFRWHAARDLVALWQQMCSGQYNPGPSMVFMATHPVFREIWSGAYHDRIVHHWEALRYGGPLEEYFNYAGNMSMNCRKGYGALLAVETFQQSICRFTANYTRDDCYIVGGDFKQFFPSISKPMAYGFMEELLCFRYKGIDLQPLLHHLRITIHHRPQENFFRISPESMWANYPKTKSLFHSEGFAPGNLISQHVANLVGAVFMMWMIFEKKAAGFMIFVDDWRCLVRSREEGRKLIAEAKEFLRTELGLTLHPDKIYLQHYTKGTKMVGAVIKPPCNKPSRLNRILALHKWMNRGFNGTINRRKFFKFLLGAFNPSQAPRLIRPGRIYISNRTRGHFIDAMKKYNAMPEAQTHAGRMALLEKLRASINSYLGMMCHFNSYRVRRHICEKYILPLWKEYLYFEDGFTKCIIKVRYDKRAVIKRKLRSRKYAAKFIRPKWTPQAEV